MPPGSIVRAGLAGLAVLAGCSGPLLDSPGKVRHTDVFLPPLFSSYSSEDGTSHEWSALFWLVGHDVEGTRTHTRALPFWWRDESPPYSENTLLFPLWYSRQSEVEDTRMFTPLYTRVARDDIRGHYVLGPILWWESSLSTDYHRSSILFLYDWKHHGEQDDLTVISLLGLVTGFRLEAGRPPEGEIVPALGREHSRRLELANIFFLVTAFGYDDIGDRREIRVLTLLNSEMLSPLRSWRGRGEDPFVREWIFPLYMNAHDSDGSGWLYVGPLWGQIDDPAEGTSTDWWLLGLLSRTEAEAGNTWKVAGFTVAGP
ncbi:MAG TPA: hypothetical protein VFD43_08710 [Planctomycetota bacterium]|nr:hypothetical protein [Planctomycetota bacterium]